MTGADLTETKLADAELENPHDSAQIIFSLLASNASGGFSFPSLNTDLNINNKKGKHWCYLEVETV